ncbi:MAG: cation:proton antiporter [Candidatus Roseilinea sp.]|nr:MAG: cation:proton antiporter [Candidatus Roseilinea sp.]
MPPSVLVILPIIVPLTAAAVSVLLRSHRRLQAAWSFGAMVAAFVCSSLLLWTVVSSGAPVVFQLGNWPAPAGISLVGDPLSALMAVMCQLVLVGGFLYALGCRDQCAQYPAFYPLFLMLAAGLTGAMLTGDLFNLFVFAELLVFAGAALTAMSDDKFGTEAAYKYFYISFIASIALLLASGSLYVSYGTLNIADLTRRIAADPSPPLVLPAMALLMIFFMVKGAVMPFHFWQPDFHTAAPTPVHAVLSSVVVKLGIYGFLRMTTLLFVEQAETIRSVLVVVGAVGVWFGGLGAVGTYDAKRMLAYSTLGQLGFILVAIGWGTPLALAAAIVYAFNHSLLKAAMLMLAGSVASRAPVKTAAFAAITGLGKKLPWAGVLFLLGGMGLAGIPPLNGFIGKLLLFNSGVDAQAYPSLAAIGLAGIVTLVYVIRAFQRIWWAPLPEGVKPKPYGDRLIAPALLIALSLALGIWAEPLVNLAQATVAWMNLPELYVRAVLGG